MIGFHCIIINNFLFSDVFKMKHIEPDKVAKIKAWIPLVNKPRKINGIGITKGTKETKTATTSSSAKMFPKSLKLKDKGFVKSSKTFIGNNIGVGCTYFLK